MLERTAGCLESGSLRRLLPASRRSLKSCRTLHSGFWTHGGGDIELSPFWAALVQATSPVSQQDEPSTAKTPSRQSGMLLDFLYPAGTLNFLRQYSVWGADRQDGRWARYGVARIGQRQYTSSAKDKIPTSDTSIVEHKAWEEDEDLEEDEEMEIEADEVDLYTHDTNIDTLLERMKLTRRTDFEEAWRQYQLLPAADQRQLRPQLMLYLSPSDRDLDSQRVIDLFELLEEQQRTSHIYRTAVRSFLKLRNLAGAMRLHTMALEKLAIPAGSEELLSYLFDNASWTRAISFWEEVTKLEVPEDQRIYNIYEVLDKHPNLASHASALAEEINRRIQLDSNHPETTSRLLKFGGEIVRRALLDTKNFNPSIFNSLLQTLRKWRLDTPSIYEQAMIMLVHVKQQDLALKCYRLARLRDVNIIFTRKTLLMILRICCRKHNDLGMKEVLDDYFRIYRRPSPTAYKLCMREFAARGDVRTVHALWEQYISRFTPGSRIDMTASDFAPILHVHATRGELQEVIRLFDKMKTSYGLHPNIICWNILLNAYGKVHDYEGAYSCFEELLNDRTCRPTHMTIGTMMAICTQQGDIDRIIELYMLAENMDIHKSAAMLDNLVLAHIQDDDFEEAEKICVQGLRMSLIGRRTRMWNYLLVAYAQRRDVDNVNRVLQRMSEADIEYDTYTYSALMQAMCMIRQPDRAYQILREVMPDAGISATSFHYAVVMGGYIAVGNPRKAFHVQTRMFRKGFTASGSTKLLAMKARFANDERLLLDGTPEEVMQGALQLFREAMDSMDAGDIVATPKKGAARYAMDVAYPSMFYSYVMHILASSSDTAGVDQLYAEFMSILPESRQDHSPLSIMSALMFSKLRDNDHQSVEECWRLSLAQAKERGQALPPISTGNDEEVGPPLSPYKILPFHQLDLTKHLYIYLESLSVQNKIESMVRTVDEYLADGFKLDNRTWNYYIRLLGQKYRYKLAFKHCEQLLIDNWTGWQLIRWSAPVRNRLPFHLRNLRKQAKHLRPIHITLLYLARALLDIQAMAAESRASEILLEDIRMSFPKTIKAIETMPRSDTELERSILREY